MAYYKQETDELRAKFPGDDGEALEVIALNFKESNGFICKKDRNYEPTDREWEAIDYLFQEWDYAYSE